MASGNDTGNTDAEQTVEVVLIAGKLPLPLFSGRFGRCSPASLLAKQTHSRVGSRLYWVQPC